MMKSGWVALVAVLIAAVAGTVLYGQGGGAAGRGTGAGTGAGSRELDRMKLTLELLGLSTQELAAAQKSGEAKMKARQALQEELGKLRQVADDSRATDQELTRAVGAYTKAMGRYRATVQSEDGALGKKLSARSRARCLAAGALDNGLGGGSRTSGGRGRGGGGDGGGGRGGGAPGGPPG